VMEQNDFFKGSNGDFGLPNGALKELLGKMIIGLNLNVVQKAILAGNRFSECIGTTRGTVAVSYASELEVRDNEFDRNAGMQMWVSKVAKVAVTGNRFLGNHDVPSAGSPDPLLDTGLVLASMQQGDLVSAVVENNTFEHFADGYSILVDQYHPGNYALKGNVFANGGGVFFNNPKGAEAVSVSYANNYHFDTPLRIGMQRAFDMTGNALVMSFSGLTQQTQGAVGAIAGNTLFGGRLLLLQSSASIEIHDNEVTQCTGYGIAVVASPGTSTIRHNLVYNTQWGEMPAVGSLGDGIHVSGSTVLVENNRLFRNPRLGLLISGSYGVVNGNFFADNGCGAACNFVIQDLPAPDAVTGTDAANATYGGLPYSTLAFNRSRASRAPLTSCSGRSASAYCFVIVS
jgi:hypothetical protein